MQSDLMKRTAVLTALFVVLAMGAIFYLSATKVVTISDVAQDEVAKASQEEKEPELTEPEQAMEQQSLNFVSDNADTGYLRIPLPEKTRAEDIVIENYYMDQELCILIGSASEDFYLKNAISGNREAIQEGSCEAAPEGVRLRFQLSGIFEYRTILEEQDLYVNFLSPREMYDRLIVIDPACGGGNEGHAADGLTEKDINLKIAQKLKEKLDATDIKVYYTRMDDVNPSEESRVELANQTRADMYIRIQADAIEDTTVYGTTAVYNGNYFIPGFGSVELADALEREVVTSIRGKALGLEEASEEEYAIRYVTIPAAAIKTGYLSNKQEATLLGREEYQDKIATGIYQAILKIYEEYL